MESKFIVKTENTFKLRGSSNKRPYVHFFQQNSKNLHIYYLDAPNPSWDIIELASEEKIPLYHRSIATHQGDLYLIGGVSTKNDYKSEAFVYKVNFEKVCIEFVNTLNIPRHDFGICIFNNKLVIAGGASNSGF